jgi:poly-gamma-glutamate synthesis protein (capsule biosynthesis protein)
MNRRDFVQSTGKWLLALAVPGFGHSMAGMKSAVVTSPGVDKSVTLFLCGDVMTGRGIDQVLPHPCDPLIHEHYIKSALGYVDIAEEVNGPIPKPVDFSYIWGDALGELDGKAPDLRIINLETSVTTSDDFWPRKGINYRMHPDNTPAISAAGIDCCVLANNHVLDWGYPGLEETLDTLRKAGLQTPGAGRNLEQARAPAIFDLGEKGRVIVFSLASETSGVPSAWAATHDKAGVNFITDFSPASVNKIANQVRALKQADDIVVLSIHWGGNWGYEVSFEQREFAHQLIDKAAIDLIHGHSSHHPRGIEVYRNKPIIYGCGDFINDYEGISGHESFRDDLSLMYFLDIAPANGKLIGLEMVPHQIRKFRLNRASKQDAAWLKNTLHREGQKFNTRVDLNKDGVLALRWRRYGSRA